MSLLSQKLKAQKLGAPTPAPGAPVAPAPTLTAPKPLGNGQVLIARGVYKADLEVVGTVLATGHKVVDVRHDGIVLQTPYGEGPPAVLPPDAPKSEPEKVAPPPPAEAVTLGLAAAAAEPEKPKKARKMKLPDEGAPTEKTAAVGVAMESGKPGDVVKMRLGTSLGVKQVRVSMGLTLKQAAQYEMARCDVELLADGDETQVRALGEQCAKLLLETIEANLPKSEQVKR